MGGMRRDGRAGEQNRRAEGVAHLEHALRHVHFVGVERPREPLEVAQHLEARHAQAARAHGGDRRRLAAGMADDVGRVEHDLREARLAHRLQLRLERPGEGNGVRPEVIQVHGLPTTNSKVTPPRYTWVRAPLSLGCTAPWSTNTTPRSCSAFTAFGTSGAPKPTR